MACARKLRGLRQKLDALCVQNGQSLSKYQGFILICYKGISYFNLFELQTFCVFKMHHSNPHHQFLTLSDLICYFSCIYWFFEQYDPENEKHYKWTLKRLKLGMVSSFHPHGMCKKVKIVKAKTGCTSYTNWTLSFEVSGFRTKTHPLHRH